MANPLETDTNKVYRKKYFMDADKVVFAADVKATDIDDQVNTLIDSDDVEMNEKTVLVTHGLDIPQDSIRVEVIKDGDRIEKLNITCPCGRHTEIDAKYEKEKR